VPSVEPSTTISKPKPRVGAPITRRTSSAKLLGANLHCSGVPAPAWRHSCFSLRGPCVELAKIDFLGRSTEIAKRPMDESKCSSMGSLVGGEIKSIANTALNDEAPPYS
jgi:hypothetical protein